MKKQIKKEKVRKYLIIGLIFLILVLVAFQLGFNEFLFTKKNEIKEIKISEECSIIMNKLIHQIGNADECRAACRAKCEIQILNLQKSEFFSQNSSCNTCICFCR